MTVRVTKPEFNLRDKLSQLELPVGSSGRAILASDSLKEVQELIGVGSRNMLINGDMKIAQRGTSSTPNGTSANQYPCIDRWGGQFSDSSVFTVSQSTDAPVGHTHSFKFLTNSALDPSGSHYFHIGQNIEGNVFSAAGWNASASGRTKTPQPCTLSFWVKSSNPGKWCIALKGMNTHTYSYLIVYEIQKPDTWEWKTHTIYPSPELTNWQIGTSAAMRIQFDVGTSRFTDLGTGIINRWQNHNTYTYNNQKFQPARIHGIAGATWYLTGVQFEPGPVATPFEQRSFGQELALCYRYYRRFSPYSPTSTDNYCGYGIGVINQPSGGIWTFPVDIPMRDRPAITQNNLRIYDGSTNANITAMNTNRSSQTSIWVEPTTSSSSFTTGRAFLIGGNNTAGGYVELDAEL